ncbi:MAG: cell wall metabolism sensor histidine kinase WalK [Candidatus Omnitrophica bacterium]|nr:cell wall metabolism sensor histidine kinase WalK [Candidatus Omnitrophota bacterium]
MQIITIIYIITAVISILIGLWLYNLTRSIAQTRTSLKSSVKKEEPDLSLSPAELGSSLQFSFEDVDKVIKSNLPSEEIAKRLTEIFNKEIEKKTTEITKKYQELLDREKQNEEIAWRKYKKALSDKQKTEAVIRSIAEGLVVVDKEGKIIMMNPAAEKLLGISKKEATSKSLLENLKEEQLVSLVKKGSEEEKEIELHSQNEETKRILRASSAIIEDENGETIGMVSVLSDITKQKELDRMKDNFVANVSHELRTPLVALERSLNMILTGQLGEISPAQKEFLSIAQRNLKRLSLLINDLLDLSKIQAGRMQIAPVNSSLERIIDEAIKGLENWAKTKSIEIIKKIKKDIPEFYFDSNRIIQVLNNLIGNAIKFTPQNGKITVCAELKDDFVWVSVEDTGVGIPKDKLEKIFDRFYQVSERTPTDISGTGLGLSISKEIIQLHGGRIWAESEENKGAKFTFTLPFKTGGG